jgi:UDP-sugar transporter A1/2/3
MLNRKLSKTKWISLGILTVGIALVVLPKGTVQQETTSIGNQSNAKGLISVLAAF